MEEIIRKASEASNKELKTKHETPVERAVMSRYVDLATFLTEGDKSVRSRARRNTVARVMPRYEALTAFLKQVDRGVNSRTLTFDEMEGIVGRPLPASVKRYSALWSNTQSYYARLWLDAGWWVAGRDIEGGRITFIRRREPQPEVPGNGAAQTESGDSPRLSAEAGPAGIPVHLDSKESQEIRKLSKTGDKAIAIVKKYLRKRSGQKVQIDTGEFQGANLCVRFEDGKEELIAVKGTSAADLNWTQLKVTSVVMYNSLVRGVPVYRVIDVDGKSPRIVILRYGRDFVMRPESRWGVKPVHR